MSSNDGWQRVRRAAVAAALVILLGACPSGAGDENTGIRVTAAAVAAGRGEPPQPGLSWMPS